MKTRKIVKEIEKIILSKNQIKGIIEGKYSKTEVKETWNSISDSARKSIFFFTDSKLINIVNDTNNKLLSNDLVKKKLTLDNNSNTYNADSLLNVFEILWNLSNAAVLEDKLESISPELIDFAKKMQPGTHLLRIKDEYIQNILHLIEKVLDNCFEGNKIILPENMSYIFFPERYMKTWEDFEVGLAFLLENALLKAHIERLTLIYKNQTKDEIFEDFEGAEQVPKVNPLSSKKKSKHKKKKLKNKNIKQMYSLEFNLYRIQIQRWWRKKSISKKEESSTGLVIVLSEEELFLKETDRSSSSIGSSTEENEIPYIIEPLSYIKNDYEERDHKRKKIVKFEDEDDIERVIQQEYILSEQRLYKDVIEKQKKYKNNNCENLQWQFYPVVNGYYPYQYSYNQNLYQTMTPVILPYYQTPYYYSGK